MAWASSSGRTRRSSVEYHGSPRDHVMVSTASGVG